MSKKNSYSSWTFKTLKARALQCLKTPRTKHPATKCHTLEEHINSFPAMCMKFKTQRVLIFT